MKILNILLTLSAAVLAFYLFLNLKQPYQPKTQPSELMNDKLSVTLEEAPAFKEKIFKSKRLFYTASEKKPGQKKPAFILLGVSSGERNLALVRDANENMDYYCAVGDSIGFFKVKQIFKDKVILECDGNITEITR